MCGLDDFLQVQVLDKIFGERGYVGFGRFNLWRVAEVAKGRGGDEAYGGDDGPRQEVRG